MPESVLPGPFTFTSPSAYIAINTMTMAFGCVWPPFSTRENIILTLAPGVLQSLVANSFRARPTPRSFNFEDLQPPVPAKAYNGTFFPNGDWGDIASDDWEEENVPQVIKEGEYMPRVVLPKELMSVDPLYSRCRPYAGNNYENTGWLAAWDPLVELVGTPVNLMSKVVYTSGQTTNPDVPRSTAVKATTTAFYSSNSNPQSIESRPFNSNSIYFPQHSLPPQTAPPQTTPLPTQESIVILPSQPGDLVSQLQVAIGTATATLIAAGPAATIGSRTISLNSGGGIVVIESNQAQTIGRTVQGAFPSVGLQKMNNLTSSGAATNLNEKVSLVRSVEGNGLSYDTTNSPGVATTTTSTAFRMVRMRILTLIWYHLGCIYVVLNL
jgi:hypothetical protein